MKEVAFDNMGEAALKTHAKPNPPGKALTKHQRLMAEKEKASKSRSVLHYMSPTQSSTSFPSPQSSQSTSRSSEDQCSESPTFSQQNSVQPTMDTYIMSLSVAHAEIRWAMKVVTSYFSLRCLDIKYLFSSMFPHSQIASQFSMSKTKCGYLINYGLAPYYKERLLKEIKKSPFFTVLFDESLNNIFQTEQMDAHVRYWCADSNRVKTRYLDSQFFNRPNADNITQGIYDALKSLPKEAMIHLGMDGPSTNWSVLDKVQERRKEADQPVLENIGSCGLHIISGALQTGVKESSWPLKSLAVYV